MVLPDCFGLPATATIFQTNNGKPRNDEDSVSLYLPSPSVFVIARPWNKQNEFIVHQAEAICKNFTCSCKSPFYIYIVAGRDFFN